MINKKKNILILIDWYLPGRKAGGPVKSIESLVFAMREEFNFFILTTDTDLGEIKPYDGVVTDKWLTREDGSKVFYMRAKELSETYLCNCINSVQYDVIYINSFYSPWFSICPLRLRKKNKISGQLVLASRGMLSKGALALKSFKKKAFIQLSRFTGLHKGIRWHATYPEEEKEIRHYFGTEADVRLAKNFSKTGMEVSVPYSQKKKGELKLFYLSRISRVKNLHIALKALSKLSANAKIEFDIYGAADDEGYFEECKGLAAGLAGTIKINFKGIIANEEAGAMTRNYHFLFLPTSNENFGHSIFESLQSGCPVIISNRTPWRNLNDLGCGWDLEPTIENFANVLNVCVDMEQDQLNEMRTAAKKLAELHHRNFDEIKRDTLHLFS